MSALLVLCTAASPSEAKKLANALVRERLAACVTIVPVVESHYRWKGKIVRDREALLLIKTRSERYGALEKRVRALHSYTVPEVLAFPAARGSRDYLRWLIDSTQK